MDSLSALTAFVRAAEFRSFTDAGRELRLSPSTVGKAISRLEEKHGVRLFNRSTRSIMLTHEGQLFLESCRRIFSEIENVEREFAQTKSTPRGRLRVSSQAELQSTQAIFGGTLRSSAALEKMTKSRERGLGTAGEFELDLGRQIGDL